MRAITILTIPWLLAAQDGFSPIIGGLPFDSGVALGLEYNKPRVVGDFLDFRAKAIGSVKKYEFLEAGIAAPRLAGRFLFAEAQVRYRNYPEEDFWGLGARSSRNSRTTFRLEDIDYRATLGVRPKPWLEIGTTGGILNTNSGPGKDQEWPSIEQRFTQGEAPALNRQPHYIHAGAGFRVDYRDEPADPRRGGFYQLRWTAFHDRRFDHFHFRRYDVDLRQFAPTPWRPDTVAVRAQAILSDKGTGQQVPFFMQPTAGGGSDLRGYRQYRFRDENALVFNVEYRWRIREILQLVNFADAGRVFSRPGQIGLSGLRGSVGFGGRVRIGESLVLGIDVGWSPEGPRLWLRGAHTF